MSTLGGSRGERQAKPKFSALDINTLYRTSRGESLEPTAQKCAAPRKHGMQSLGKVPSARRPPANLPSLKAETQLPADQSGSWIPGSGPENTSNAGSSASAQNPAAGDDQQHQLKPGGATLIGQAHASSSGSAANSANTSDQRPSSTWSTVATKETVGHSVAAGGQSSIYQSPQFQHEFPSLDSSPPSSGNAKATVIASATPNTFGNSGERYSETRGMNSRQIQTQQTTTPVAASGGPTADGDQALQVPPQFRALMPQFMYRGNGSGASSGFGSFGGTSSSSYNSSGSSAPTPNRPRSQPGAQSSLGGGNYADQHARTQNYHGRSSGGRSGGRGSADDRDHQKSMPYVEPEVALMQRPIIKEEELQRIESIAKNEGWCKYDKIDYNQKLNFSDDETTDTATKPDDNAANDRAETENQLTDRLSNGHWQRGNRQEDERKAFDKREIKCATIGSAKKDEDTTTAAEGKSSADQGSVFRQMTDVRSYVNVRKGQSGAEKGRGGASAYDGKYDREGGTRDRHNSASSGGGGSSTGANVSGQQQVERDRDGNIVYFSKHFMNNLPPRFQNSKGDRADRLTGLVSGQQPSASSGGDRRGEKNVPFAQQFDIRFINTQAGAQQNVNARNKGLQRNVSGDDMRRLRPRLDSEEEEKFSGGKDSMGRTHRAPRSERKLSISSEDRNNRTDSWSEDMGGDLSQILNKTDESVASSNKDDSIANTSNTSGGGLVMHQPKHILQRNQAITKTGEIKKIDETDADPSFEDKEKTTADKAQDEAPKRDKDEGEGRDKLGRSVSRGGRTTVSRNTDPRTGYTSYSRGGQSNWSANRRGGRMSGRNYGEYAPGSDSEGEEYESDYGRGNMYKNRANNSSSGKASTTSSGQSLQQEGFAPRGEPTRRGRGGSSSGAPVSSSGSFNRRGGASSSSARGDIPKRIDNYGPPGAKSPFNNGGSATSSEVVKDKGSLSEKKASGGARLYQHKTSGSDDGHGKKPAEDKSGESHGDQTHQAKETPKVDTQQQTGLQRSSSGLSSSSRSGGTGSGKFPKDDNKGAGLKTKSCGSVHVERQKSAAGTNTGSMPTVVNKALSTIGAGGRPGSAPKGTESQKDANSRGASVDSSMEESLHRPTTTGSNTDKVKGTDKAILDGSAPVSTIIFENTNFKHSPAPIKRQTSSGGAGLLGDKKEEQPIYNVLDETNNLSSTMSKMMMKDADYEFTFENEISQLTDDKVSKVLSTAPPGVSAAAIISQPPANVQVPAGIGQQQQMGTNMMMLSRSSSGVGATASSIHSASAQNTISTAELNMKIASVKKVWENTPFLAPVLEQQGTDDQAGGSGGVPAMSVSGNVASSHLSNYPSQHPHQMHHFATHNHTGNLAHVPHTFVNTGFDPTVSLEQHFSKQNPMVVDSSANGGDQENVVGYSPSPQHGVGSTVSGTAGAPVRSVDPLVAGGAGTNKVKQSQGSGSSGSIHPTGLSPPPLPQNPPQSGPQAFYQPSAQTYGGIPTIPSPPAAAMMYNSTQAAGLYHPFPIDTSRSHLSQFTGHYNTTNNAAAAQYSYMSPAAPDMYQSITSQFRMGQSPFNQSQQQQLMSTSSNSLMSGSVKPQSQAQIGAIGSKSGGSVGQPPYGQQYIYPTGPTGPHPPPQMQQSSQYYSNSGGQGTYFGNPAAATQNYNVQAAGMFGQHGGPGPNSGPPPPQQQVTNFNSQYLNITAAAALNQQYRSGPTQQMTAYMNSKQQQVPPQGQQQGGGHLAQDHTNRRNEYEYFSKNYKDLPKRHQ